MSYTPVNASPSWTRWPPNSCETCKGPWVRLGEWNGKCGNSASLNYGELTDARFRCQDFKRKPETKKEHGHE